MIEAIKNAVIKLVVDEYDRANREHPALHSDHEAFAVLVEEVCELGEELDAIRGNMRDQWELIRKNESSLFTVAEIELYAIRAACEAVQVAAVCERWKDAKGNQTREKQTREEQTQ